MPALVDAMAYGVLILLPCDVIVERGAFSWEWGIPEPATRASARAPELPCPGPVRGSTVRAVKVRRDQVQ